MTEEQLAAWGKKFDDADKDENGKLSPVEFRKFFPDIIPKLAGDTDAADRYFRGIDIDGNGDISKEEFLAFVTAALTNDKEYSLKLVFRAFDVNNNGILEHDEIKQIGIYLGVDLDDQKIDERIGELAGEDAKGLNFKQLANLLGVDVAEDADPRDGKGPKPIPPAAKPDASADAAATPAEGAPAEPQAEEAKKSKCCLLL
jgi:Ca2+-binding EF-hand superfamily protein